MGNSILINTISREKRVAVIESGSLVEFYSERPQQRQVVGNIYKGKILRVLPGMQAAFIDIGLEKAAFLYVADAIEPTVGEVDLISQDEDSVPPERVLPPIAELFSAGDEIVVQIKKAPVGTKGARVTSHVTLPGRNVVLMPNNPHIGISRRIENEQERERLTELLTALRGSHEWGLIARTVSEGVENSKLENDLEFLQRLWKEISHRSKKSKPPALIYEDLDLILRSIRDILDDNVEQIVVDTKSEYERIHNFIEKVAPRHIDKVLLYDDMTPIFDKYGVEAELERAMSRKVWLKSGGYIIIESTEALTVVDVNTGKFVGHQSLEQTITQLNIEAAKEIAQQLRLRNIGGIVVVDFIDMEQEINKEKVMTAFEEALRRDRARTYLVGMTELGLVQLTRKRYQDPLGTALTQSCKYCDGMGRVKSTGTMVHEVLRALQLFLMQNKYATVLINMHPDIADALYDQESEAVELLESRSGTEIIFVAREGYHEEQFEIVSQKAL